MCRLSSLMRPLAIVLFHVVFTRAYDTIVYEKGRGKNNTNKFRSGYTTSNTIVIRWLVVVS